jgi:hypothetical protein
MSPEIENIWEAKVFPGPGGQGLDDALQSVNCRAVAGTTENVKLLLHCRHLLASHLAFSNTNQVQILTVIRGNSDHGQDLSC